MPGLTFPRLLRLHRAHIDKLQRDRPGAAYRLRESVEDVMAPLNDFPGPSARASKVACTVSTTSRRPTAPLAPRQTTKPENTDDVADGDTDKQE